MTQEHFTRNDSRGTQRKLSSSDLWIIQIQYVHQKKEKGNKEFYKMIESRFSLLIRLSFRDLF